jgi:hypothetical protein
VPRKFNNRWWARIDSLILQYSYFLANKVLEPTVEEASAAMLQKSRAHRVKKRVVFIACVRSELQPDLL